MVAVNPDNDSVSVFNAVTKLRASVVALPAGSMPVSVAVAPDNTTAWVVGRKSQRLYRINNINNVAPTVLGTGTVVGSEPTGVALSPNGTQAVVANFGEDTISIVDTSTGTARKVTVGPNPRAVAITNNGDTTDTDETAYVTLFFGEATAEVSDTGRTGKVIPVPLTAASTAGTPINLAPIANAGLGAFVAADGGFQGTANVGCAVNQLFNIAISGTRAYVTSVCASPAGAVNPTTNLFAAVSVINLGTNLEDTGAKGTTSLARLLRAQDPAFATSSTSLLGVPIELDFKPGSQDVAYVVSQAADRVQRVIYGGAAVDPQLGIPQIDVRTVAGATVTKVPIGIVTANGRFEAWVNNWVDRSVTFIDLTNQMATQVVRSDALPTAPAELAKLSGKRFYFTGTGRWALRGVNSCGSCHPDALSDNITWLFAAGPRQTTPMDGTYSKAGTIVRRALNWTSIFDEVHDFELNTRGTAGGKGALVDGTPPNDTAINLASRFSLDGGLNLTQHDFLSGSTIQVNTLRSTVKDWDDIDAFSRTIPANKAPTNIVGNVAAGRTQFQSGGCHHCHGTALWTVSRVPYLPNADRTGSVAGTAGVPPATGYRTETVDGGVLTGLPNSAGVNQDTLKVAVETGVTIEDGGTGNVGPERLTCTVRRVGTFNAANLLERKANGTMAQGGKGFNVPSLLSLATTGPYLHHGGVKNLADLVNPNVTANLQHLQAGNAIFNPNAGEQADLVAFLRSIDESTAPFAPGASTDICFGY